jgi:predicted ester cyclase
MRILNTIAVAFAALMLVVATSQAQSNDVKIIESFYMKLLTATGSTDRVVDADGILAAEWVSIGDYSGKTKDRATFVKQLNGFVQQIPDLTWKIEEIISSGDRYIVRGRASGTPNGPFFGVEPAGKTFQIMSIDIHSVKGGKIVQSYHVEDWAGALGQLRAK